MGQKLNLVETERMWSVSILPHVFILLTLDVDDIQQGQLRQWTGRLDVVKLRPVELLELLREALAWVGIWPRVPETFKDLALKPNGGSPKDLWPSR